jgi:c-di-GMP-binding flagellar brake protein YcgR
MSMEKGWLEKQRQHERVKDILKIVFYPIDGTGAQEILKDDYRDTTVEQLASRKSGIPALNAMTEDISKGGLSIITDKPLAMGQLVIIDLYLPEMPSPVKLLSEVRNIDTHVKGAATYKAGVKILSVSKSDLKKIENRIYELKFEK